MKKLKSVALVLLLVTGSQAQAGERHWSDGYSLPDWFKGIYLARSGTGTGKDPH